MKVLFSIFCLSIFYAVSALARPLITEEAQTVGKYTFEAGFKSSLRIDEFGTPETRLETIVVPVRFQFGFTEKFDVGIRLQQVDQRLKLGSAKFSGSSIGQFSLFGKYFFKPGFGLLARWDTKQAEDEEEFSIPQGNDVEVAGLFKLFERWPTHLNLGLVFRGNYNTTFGVNGGPLSNVEPGNVFFAKGSTEIPLRYHINLLTELAYYEVATQSVNGVETLNSDGEALDLLTGLTWAYADWNIGLGVAFGLLDESHTSFAVDKGAGDVMYKFSLAYKLTPKARAAGKRQ